MTEGSMPQDCSGLNSPSPPNSGLPVVSECADIIKD